MTNPNNPLIRACVLAESDRRDAETARVHNAWRAGYAAAQADCDDAYDRGYADGALLRKHAQHDLYGAVRAALDAWPGGREHAGDPRPGDYTGGPVPWNTTP